LAGLGIALLAVVIATLLSAYLAHGEVTLPTVVEVQRRTFALWCLDAVPFLFVLWGQWSGNQIVSQTRDIVRERMDEPVTVPAPVEDQLAYEAMHDSLTDLHNREAFYARTRRALAGAGESHVLLAVVLLDVDRFKEINETLGYINGDHLLRQLGGRLRTVVREPCFCARLGGDEFAILLVQDELGPDIDGRRESLVDDYVGQIRRALSAPFAVEHLTFELAMSVGACWAPEHGTDPHMLLRNAELAMFAAKQVPSGFYTFRPELDRYNPRRLSTMGDLANAISNEHLTLHYQPKIAFNQGVITGVEALVRWPNGGEIIGPDEFITLAESTRLIKPLTTWVLNQAVRQAALWSAQGYQLPIAVNLSGRDLHDQSLPETLKGILNEHDVEASAVTLEIADASISVDQVRALDVLGRLSDLGCPLVIDDFATGHSSLAYVALLPVNSLKIARAFVSGMAKRPDNEAVVCATIQLAHSLGLTVTAVGVETEQEWALLKQKGCDEAQGFHMSRALEPHAVEVFVREFSQARCLSLVHGTAS
jgi:diguanylate cyclase (GGDEF)-like protein